MIVDDTKFFKITVSFGNVVSLISLPCFMSHASIPAEVRCCDASFMLSTIYGFIPCYNLYPKLPPRCAMQR